MACPHVAGVAALLLNQNSMFSPAEVAARLVTHSTWDAVSDSKSSHNRLLYMGSETPMPTPAPTSRWQRIKARIRKFRRAITSWRRRRRTTA
mmetsp:Transcript_46626/g.89963  ORF Transcript_46626/g.89963 Transcript_46626/m.89963 type:complete len:92 (+) Transcript_46626:3-278(+)